MAEKSDFTKMLVKDEELSLPTLEKVVVPISSPNDHPRKTTTKRKSNWTLGVIHKKARKGDPSTEMDETTEEEDDEEIELRHYVEPDKKYFFVHLAKIACKLCSFKGKLIVQHYRMSHPESEVLISRINPDIAQILIEDAIRNREEYDKDHPELEKMTCNFKCPFCLMLIKDTPNMYYNHISSHTGEYCFHCDHCSYWTYSHTNIQSHLNQMHSEIHKAKYKMVYPNPKILKYVFGHICSECNFIQLIRTTVEEHAMIYHPGTPEIHRVNLGLLPHEDAVSKSNLKIPTENKELNIEEVMIKVESKVLKDDPLTDELTPFIYQPDLDIKQDYESDSNLNELVPPYNCEDDGFPNCLFKTLYFDEYLKHVVAIHQINGFSSFSSEDEPLRETIMEGWLAKEVGPFQCGYCKRATVTYQEMGRHQVMFHAQKQSSFYYRKFVPSDSVIIPEQVNMEDSSFINHVIHLPDQAHLCDFKLTGGLFSSTFPKGIDRASEVLLPEEDPKVDSDLSKCNWKDCYQIYLSQTALVKHIEKNHIERKRGEKYTCFWLNCPNKLKPFNTRRELLMHMRVHSGEKPYKCPFQGCNKAFSQMGNLRVHQKGHTGERPHFCQFSNCLKKFSSIYDRDKHQETHYNTKFYACQVAGCSKRYIYLGSLKVHMRIHEVDEQLERKSSNSSDSVKHQTLPDEPVENKEGLFSKQPSKEGSNCDDTVLATELIDEVQHKCNCGKEFATIALLKSHAFDCIQKPYEKVLLSEDSEVDPNLSKVSSDEDNKAQLFSKVDPLCLDNEPSKDGSDRDDTVLATELTSDSQHKCNCGEKFATMALLKSHALDCIQKPYRKCNWKDCYQTYHSQTGLVKHIEKNHVERKNDEKYICFWINCLNKMKPFNTKRDLRLHMRVHSREKPHKCPFQGCNKAFSRMGNLTVHQKLHTGERPHICQFSNCFKKFSSILDRDNHQRTHYNTKFYACQVPGCSKWFTLLGSLQDHMKIHEVDQQLEKKSSNNSDNTKHQRMHYGSLQCKWGGCSQPYHSEKIALVKHIKTHVKLQRGKKFTCLWHNCPRKLKPFNTKQYLLMHMKVHSGEKPYKCVGCNKTFSQSYNLKVHQRRHMREKPYSCEFSNCCKSFFELSHKIAHQRTHKDTKRYACQVSGCSKTYTNPHRLRKHMENHMVSEQLEVKQELDENNQKEVDFGLQSSNSSDGAKLQRTHFDTCKWKDCYQIYHSQTALVEHIENHVERKSGEKYTCFWINCSRTSKPFRKRYSLLVHMRVHSREKPYKCPECNRAFSRLDNLKTHGRSHTGEKPYSCQFPHCFMSFSSMSERGRHHRKHYNTKFYACQVTGCLKKFTNSSSLQAHMKNHTVDEKLEVKWNSVENEQNEGDFVLKSSSNDSELTYYNDKPYTCQVTGCSKKYTDPSNLRRHTKKSHTVNKQFEAEKKSVENEQKEDDLIIYHL